MCRSPPLGRVACRPSPPTIVVAVRSFYLCVPHPRSCSRYMIPGSCLRLLANIQRYGYHVRALVCLYSSTYMVGCRLGSLIHSCVWPAANRMGRTGAGHFGAGHFACVSVAGRHSWLSLVEGPHGGSPAGVLAWSKFHLSTMCCRLAASCSFYISAIISCVLPGGACSAVSRS